MGEAGEQLVWEAVQTAFANRKCLAYWRYPIFSPAGKFRKEPDILIADYNLGLIVIEVKAITIEQIVNIQGHRWEYQNFYTSYGNPYQQAENQLFALLEYTKREPSLAGKITARVAIALPYISQQQWQQRDFHLLPSSPPILFQNHLSSSASICEAIAQIPPIIAGTQTTLNQWQLLLAILGGTQMFSPPSRRILASTQSRGNVLKQVRSRFASAAAPRLSQLDLQQEKIAKQIPPGPQRIRGIAGSGKTVLLCQKAAHMHLKHPDWQIAFVFFSRSLYDTISQQIDKWIRYFTGDRQSYNPQDSHLQILHGWGGKQQAGFYSTLCQLTGKNPLTVQDTESKKPNEALGEVCLQLLESTAIPQVFDAILIDEGQDLVVDNWKYGNKQPFYWLAYQALRPVNPVHPEQKRLIWAYDEAQSLDSLNIPTASEIFGEELGHLVIGKYPDGIDKTEIMSRCYRTPHHILTTAHGIGMGLLRRGGMLTGITRQEDWEAIGYEVQGSFQIGQQIILKRPLQNSPNPVTELWQGEVIEFKNYFSRQQELTALANNIKHNLRHDGLCPSREILVLVLGNFWEASQLGNQVAKFLIKQGIDIYLPGSSQPNLLHTQANKLQPNQFWYEGLVTISTIHRAKGQEADMVYIVGLDNIAKDESNIYLRNQLFVALTRARGWVTISGIENYPLYTEIQQVINSGDTFEFTYQHSPQREIYVTTSGELLTRFALGERNFDRADLTGANLANVCLNNANLIGANLRKANLQNTKLIEVKLIVADLSHADLSGANLSKAKLMGANLQGANLCNADLTGADLSNANLQAAKLIGSKLIGANLSGIDWQDADLTDAQIEKERSL
ncbi:pentapeptide repeat-containing protein [Pleurocapsales cyanobacterium LEGE 06147]|nr:pentapeptide repeat-containing protein [Pleurocapsales cyanobacterium LEGE 06147]